MTLGRWIPAHRGLLVAAAAASLGLALASGVRDYRRRGSRTGLALFGVALLVTVALLGYARLKDGFLF